MTIEGATLTQNQVYLHLLLGHVGDRYFNDDARRCTGNPGWDCSGFAGGDLFRAAGGPAGFCQDTDWQANWLIDSHRTCSWAVARATPGAWAIRTKENSLLPHDGHIVISLGNGLTVEAHSHADGVIQGHYDGNRGFQVFGFPPLSGIGLPVGPLPLPGGPSGSPFITLSESDPAMILCEWKHSTVVGRIPFATLDISNKVVWLYNGAALWGDQPTADKTKRVWKIGVDPNHPHGVGPIQTPTGMAPLHQNADGTGKVAGVVVSASDGGSFKAMFT